MRFKFRTFAALDAFRRKMLILESHNHYQLMHNRQILNKFNAKFPHLRTFTLELSGRSNDMLIKYVSEVGKSINDDLPIFEEMTEVAKTAKFNTGRAGVIKYLETYDSNTLYQSSINNIIYVNGLLPFLGLSPFKEYSNNTICDYIEHGHDANKLMCMFAGYNEFDKN
jgi:hypothetical protein